ncbi:MAG TPA: ATP-binding cassette domain-containing protein [Acidimicrobiales bacterium]|nr:ATP-binding cassette domain-containing protein [Acidimicrobiales bacterium]
MPADPTVRFDAVSVRRGGPLVLRDVDWEVRPHERWVVIGPNGSGKTTLLQLVAGYLHPTAGTVEVLGAPLGRVDVRALRTRIGISSAAVAKMLRPDLAAVDVVMTAKNAALEPWWHHYTAADRARAVDLLARAGLADAVDRPFGVLSEGERQQVLLARTLMAEVELLIFDEPAAGLDLGARERLVARLDEVARDPVSPPALFVTHHVEEIPPSFTSALVLRRGEVVASGPIDDTITSAALSDAFELSVRVSRVEGRFLARAARG